MVNGRWSTFGYAMAIFVAFNALFCYSPSWANAAGVQFGVGFDVQLPGRAAPPPVEVYSPPAVVERRAPERVIVEEAAPPDRVVIEREPVHRVVVEQPAPRVKIVTAPPRVVEYEEPVIVEQRTTVTTTYYRPVQRAREYREETEREYYERRSSYRTVDSEY